MHSELDRPFDSAAALLARSARIFGSRLPFLAKVTFVVYVPGKLMLQLAFAAFDVPLEGLASYLLMDVSDLVLSSIAIPAAMHGLVSNAPLTECLRYGKRIWPRMLWNKFKVEITIALYMLLLFIPGLIAMSKLALTDAIVSIEGDRELEPLARSSNLTDGRRWRVFFVVAPLAFLDLVGSFYLLGSVPGATHSRWIMVFVDSLWAVVGMWTTVAVLAMYLGLTPKRAGVVAGPPRKTRQRR